MCISSFPGEALSELSSGYNSDFVRHYCQKSIILSHFPCSLHINLKDKMFICCPVYCILGATVKTKTVLLTLPYVMLD